MFVASVNELHGTCSKCSGRGIGLPGTVYSSIAHSLKNIHTAQGYSLAQSKTWEILIDGPKSGYRSLDGPEPNLYNIFTVTTRCCTSK